MTKVSLSIKSNLRDVSTNWASISELFESNPSLKPGTHVVCTYLGFVTLKYWFYKKLIRKDATTGTLLWWKKCSTGQRCIFPEWLLSLLGGFAQMW